jgi:cytochrome c biogenesis protein CcdA
MLGLPSVVTVFAAGVFTILTPCCLPMLPPILAGGVGHRLRPLFIVAGSVVSFTGLGVATAVVGGLTPGTLRLPSMVLIVAFGAVMADDDVHAVYSKYASRLAGRATAASRTLDEERHPVAGPFALGLLLGGVWLPCVGPILGAVLAYVGTTGDVARSAALLFTYGVGFGLPLLGVAYGGKHTAARLRDRIDGVGGPETVRRAAGYALILTGVAFLFELDKLALAALS